MDDTTGQTTDQEKLRKLWSQVAALLHGVQTGVRAMLQKRGYVEGRNDKILGECSPKHLRVGVNSALINNGALVTLLVAKGVITEEEYVEATIALAKKDVESYEKSYDPSGKVSFM